MITFTPDPVFDQAVRTAWVLFTSDDPTERKRMVLDLVGTHPQRMATCPQCFGTAHIPGKAAHVTQMTCRVCVLGVVHATTATLAWDGAPKHPDYGRLRPNPLDFLFPPKGSA